MTSLDDLVAKAAGDIADAKEKYLLGVFGSVEMIERFGHDFVFEEHPVHVSTLDDGWSNDVKVRFRQEFRIRPKTDEERAIDVAGES